MYMYNMQLHMQMTVAAADLGYSPNHNLVTPNHSDPFIVTLLSQTQ